MTTKKDEGFTLIELLIVIVILGILATVTVFAVGGITQNAEENTCRNEVATVQTAVEAFYVESGPPRAYPDTDGLAAALVPTYLRDAWSNPMAIDANGVVTSTACP